MSAATDKTNLAELRRTMTLWHNRVTALGFDGVSDLIAMAEAGDDEMKKAWPIGERIALKLMMIKQIGEGSTTANSLPHVARIADEALHLIQTHRADSSADQDAWKTLFWNVAKELNCLASTFVDGNDHVARKAASLTAERGVLVRLLVDADKVLSTLEGESTDEQAMLEGLRRQILAATAQHRPQEADLLSVRAGLGA